MLKVEKLKKQSIVSDVQKHTHNHRLQACNRMNSPIPVWHVMNKTFTLVKHRQMVASFFIRVNYLAWPVAKRFLIHWYFCSSSEFADVSNTKDGWWCHREKANAIWGLKKEVCQQTRVCNVFTSLAAQNSWHDTKEQELRSDRETGGKAGRQVRQKYVFAGQHVFLLCIICYENTSCAFNNSIKTK